MASADSGKSSSSTGDFPEKPHQPRSIKFPMRDTGKQKRAFNPKWFDQFTFLHYREDSDSVCDLPYLCTCRQRQYSNYFWFYSITVQKENFRDPKSYSGLRGGNISGASGGSAHWTPARALPWTRWVAYSAPRPPADLGNDHRSLR